MKKEYKKPNIVGNLQTEGVFPAAVAAAFPALAVGVGMGTQLKRALNDGRSLRAFKSLQIYKNVEVLA